MIGNRVHQLRISVSSRLLGILSLVALLVGLHGGAVAQVAALRAQPALLSAANANPTSSLRVIVQELGPGSAAEDAVERFGGRITHKFAFIDAFAADLPAFAVRELAQADDVRWVSLDAPVVDTGCGNCVDASRLKSAYIRAIGADRVWAEGLSAKKPEITVAVVDSGIQPNPDLNKNRDGGGSRVKSAVDLLADQHRRGDENGHGTHVAGV